MLRKGLVGLGDEVVGDLGVVYRAVDDSPADGEIVDVHPSKQYCVMKKSGGLCFSPYTGVSLWRQIQKNAQEIRYSNPDLLAS